MRLVVFLLLCSLSFYAKAAEQLPVPRFVTIKASEANARTGPNVRYPIQSVYNRAGLPVEIIAEFENWRKIRDMDGEEGWLHESLLSGKRSAVIIGKEPQLLYRTADNAALAIVKLGPGVMVSLKECRKRWCEVKVSGYEGWITTDKLWGVYPDEVVG